MDKTYRPEDSLEFNFFINTLAVNRLKTERISLKTNLFYILRIIVFIKPVL